MAKILIIRFSAIGDVAMTVPIIDSLAGQYPDLEITMLSRKAMAPLFEYMPGNVRFLGVDLKAGYGGLQGLGRLFTELRKSQFDYVADFHDVLRSIYLRWRFNLIGVKTGYIDKGKEGKRKLIRRGNKVMEPQLSSFRRYADVLTSLGFPVHLNFTSIFGDEVGDFSQIHELEEKKGDMKWIGIAPFAKHEGKIYPLKLLEEVIAYFAAKGNTKIFLFGGGEKEGAVFKIWENKFPNVISTIGKLKMRTELILMSHLDVMLSMDSANMHFASLVNIPVVSIWGATHLYSGFMGWKQLPTNVVQVDLACRPCSVFGNSPCYRRDYACLNMITPKMVVDKIEGVIN